jgi:ParB family chromosome partitioning protein
MTVGTTRIRFATLDSNLLARKGEAKPALTVASWPVDNGATAVEAVSRSVPADLASRGTPRAGQGVTEVAIDRLNPATRQPRRRMDEAALAELVDSIREHGILQPILVREDAGDAETFTIIVGERRWRAAKLAGRKTVPVMVRHAEDAEAFELALVENLQREDLDPLDEAAGYRRLMDEFGRTQDDIARTVGKSRSHVANALRLLALPDEVKTLVHGGALTAGHARAVLGAEDPQAVARKVASEGLSVRATEELVRAPARREARPDEAWDTWSRRVGAATGLDVVVARGRGGSVRLELRSIADLEALVARLEQRAPWAARNLDHEATPGAETL